MATPVSLLRTDSAHPGLPGLIQQLDVYLRGIYGERMVFFDQFNGLEDIKQVVIAYRGDEAIGCGSFKAFGSGTVELKRMFVTPAQRGRRVGSVIVSEIEHWAAELGKSRIILETGHEMPGAVAFYARAGFERIDNYGPFVGVEESCCYAKDVTTPEV